ncbi:MAG TPA: hypothetical protein DCO77_06705 [Nitrospiraceae bacterium]|nr:hypothetical protein [Nitrospiraceae bacterium]
MIRSAYRVALSVAFLVVGIAAGALAEVPVITGSPQIVTPALLDWPRDTEKQTPDLTEPTANRLEDLHGELVNCSSMDLVLSTAGNYHMALRDLMRKVVLPEASDEIANWYYSTSPPISPDQIANKHLGFGNLNVGCVPQIAVGPKNLMNTLDSLAFTEGERIPIIRNRGNVILVKKGNPKHIKSIWDLGRPNVRVVTSNPYTEKGSFGNYSGSINNIAANDPNPPGSRTAEKLFHSIFNSDKPYAKWVSGKRIHHREVPWAVAYDHADAGLLFYHLALYAKRSFPDLFDIVPLGGTVDSPEPLPGNTRGTLFAVRIKGEVSNHGEWTQRQLEATERLIEAYQTPGFEEILDRHGIDVP